MKQYIVTVISFAVVFFITMIATNIVSTLFIPARIDNAWLAAGRHSSQVVVHDGFSMLPMIISSIAALGISYFFYRKFATTS